MKSIKCKDFNIIPFSYLFKHINVKFLNTLYEHQLITSENCVNFSDKMTKRLFYHTVIHELCEKYIHFRKNTKKIVIFADTISNLPEYYEDLGILNNEIYKVLKNIQKNLPILLFFPKKPVDIRKITDKYFWDEGEGLDIQHLVEFEYERFDSKTYNFQKIKNFTKKTQLKFLSESYFNTIKTKSMLYLHK